MDGASLEAAIRSMDSDGSGEVDFDEFYTWYEHQAEKQALQKEMVQIEVESKARAEAMAEAMALFNMQEAFEDGSGAGSGSGSYESSTEQGGSEVLAYSCSRDSPLGLQLQAMTTHLGLEQGGSDKGSEIFDDLDLDDLEVRTRTIPYWSFRCQ